MGTALLLLSARNIVWPNCEDKLKLSVKTASL